MSLVATLLLPLVVSAPVDSLAPEAEPRASELARARFETEGGLMFVEVHVGEHGDASEPLVFLIDSGATTAVIERSVAERLDLEMGPERGRSPGSKRADVTFRVAPRVSFRIEDHVFEVRDVIAAPCEGMARLLMGRTVHGILGHGFLMGHTLEVDHEERTLVLHDPERYEYAGGGTALPVRFHPNHGGLPFTEVVVEAESGRDVPVEMLVDSGGSLLATMGINTTDAIEAVIPTNGPRVEVQGATGLANDAEKTMHRTFATRLPRARLGPFVLDAPTTSYRDNGYTGLNLFGAQVLRRFDVVFDYARERILLEPNAHFDEEPGEDRSGLFLVASEIDDSLRRVYFVSPGTPAEAAGLERGDVLVAIDGRPADARSLHATRELFFETRAFRLRVRRGEEFLDLELVTRELL